MRFISYSTCHKLAKEEKECVLAEFIGPLEGSRHAKLLHEVSYLFLLGPQNMDPLGPHVISLSIQSVHVLVLGRQVTSRDTEHPVRDGRPFKKGRTSDRPRL